MAVYPTAFLRALTLLIISRGRVIHKGSVTAVKVKINALLPKDVAGIERRNEGGYQKILAKRCSLE